MNSRYLECYQKAVNNIDDYLEYRYKGDDKERMRQTIFYFIDLLSIQLEYIKENE